MYMGDPHNVAAIISPCKTRAKPKSALIENYKKKELINISKKKALNPPAQLLLYKQSSVQFVWQNQYPSIQVA